ncbi:MAG: hypothetical protein JRI32_06790 [Deltaproteobacteria bacterium]|nr:hypothetical protein [Deltaproteobacteria bacterium]
MNVAFQPRVLFAPAANAWCTTGMGVPQIPPFYAIEYFSPMMKTCFFSVMMAIIPYCFQFCYDALIRHASLRF